jgi:exoribonuclease-2
MQIHAILEGRSPLDPDEVGRRCAMAQAAQAPNRQAERASESHWRLIWLSRHPEWTGEAILVSAAGQGQWLAYIPEIGLETKIRLPGEFRLDETVSVKVSRIVIPTQEIVFDASVIPKTD